MFLTRVNSVIISKENFFTLRKALARKENGLAHNKQNSRHNKAIYCATAESQ